MKFIVGLMAVVALGVGIGLGYLHVTKNHTTTSATSQANTQRITALENQIDRLTQSLQNINASISRQSDTNTIASLRQRLAELEQRPPTSAKADQSEQETEDYQSVSLSARDSELSEQEYNRRVDSAFEREEVDDIWSAAVTTAIENVFQKPELATGQLASVDCRTTMCRLEVFHGTENGHEVAMFHNHMLQELPADLPSGLVRQVNGVDGVRTVAILVRKGETLPRLADPPSASGAAASQ